MYIPVNNAAGVFSYAPIKILTTIHKIISRPADIHSDILDKMLGVINEVFKYLLNDFFNGLIYWI